MFGIAEAGAHLIGAAAGPDFAGMDGDNGRRLFEVGSGAAGGEQAEVDSLLFGTFDETLHGVTRNGPRAVFVEDGGGDLFVPAYLSEFHPVCLIST